MPELWKDVEGYEGFYQVSNYGNVRSLDNFIIKKDGVRQPVKGRVLKLTYYPNGYAKVGLRKKQVMIHRLVAQAFIPNPDNKGFVNHIDGNKQNNHYTNLEWVTKSENTQHGYDNGLLPSGSKRYNSKMTEDDVRYILTHYKNRHKEFGCKPLGEKFGVSMQTVWEIVKRERWKHIQL